MYKLTCTLLLLCFIQPVFAGFAPQTKDSVEYHTKRVADREEDREERPQSRLVIMRATPADMEATRRYNDSLAREQRPASRPALQHAVLRNSYRISPDKSKVAGEIPFSREVSPTGSLRITIPLESYPGIGAASPSVFLIYDSQGGNGNAGYGWNIGGISAISSVNKTLYYDEQVYGVQPPPWTGIRIFESLSLDGKKVIKKDLSYLKTVEGNIRIYPIYKFFGPIKYFNVHYPDGSKAEYGNGDGHSFKSYGITEFSDKNGNAVIYRYKSYDSGISLIDRIEYADGKASIEFEYEDRFDKPVKYHAGYSVRNSKRLRRIRMKIGRTLLRDYSLTYAERRGVSVLTALSCSAGGKSLPPLTFEYGYEPFSTSFIQHRKRAIEWYKYDSPYEVITKKGKIGWGYTNMNDALAHYPNKFCYWYYRKKGGTFSHSKRWYENHYNGSEKIFIYSGFEEGTDFLDPMPHLVTGRGFIDILFANLDGRYAEEIIKINANVENEKEYIEFTCYASSGTSGLVEAVKRRFDLGEAIRHRGDYSCWPKEFFAADIDGDGKDEIVAVAIEQPLDGWAYKTHVYIFDPVRNSAQRLNVDFAFNKTYAGNKDDTWDAENVSDKLLLTDANGDGKTDIVIIKPEGTYTYEFTGKPGNFNIMRRGHSTGLKRTDIEAFFYTLGDFNGDGLADILLTRGGNKGVYLCDGNGNYKKTVYNLNSWYADDENGVVVHDINSDGISDLIHYRYDGNRTKMRFFLSHDNAFVRLPVEKTFSGKGLPVPTNINSKNYYGNIVFCYDGKMECLTYKSNDTREKLLTSMRNSMGIVSRIDYAMMYDGRDRLYNDKVYVSAYIGKDKYPYTEFNGNIFLVAGTQSRMGAILTEDLRYNYTGAVVHKQGLGFCGFQKMTVMDRIRNDYRILRFDPFRFGIPLSSESGREKSTFEYTVNVEKNKVRHILLNKKKITDKLRNVTTTTAYTYDDYDMPLTEHTDFGKGISRLTKFSYTRNISKNNYILGMPSSVETCRYRSGQSTREGSSYKYDTNFNMVKREDFLNGNKAYERIYAYDKRGLPVESIERPYASPHTSIRKCAYDSWGRMISETDILGNKRIFNYDAYGRLSSETDRHDNRTTYTYDEWGRVIRTFFPDGTHKKTAYRWETGIHDAIYAVVSNGTSIPETAVYYDALGREVAAYEMTFDAKKRFVSKKYDSKGRLLSCSRPYINGKPEKATYFSYDNYDRLLKTVAPSGNTTSYTYKGNSVTETKNGIPTTRTYDASGELISVTGPEGTITYDRRPDGQPLKISVPGGVETRFDYDVFGRRTAIHDPSSGSRHSTYDNAGNVVKETDANGRSIRMEYDRFGRIVKHVNAEKIATIYTYDSDGKLTKETSNNGVSKIFTYDKLGRKTKIRETVVDGNFLEISYAYSEGVPTCMSYAANGKNIGAEYFSYSNGHRSAVKWDNKKTVWELKEELQTGETARISTPGVVREYTYDKAGMPVARKTTAGKNPVYGQSMGFNPHTGNLIFRTDNRRNIKEVFTYDKMNRLAGYGENKVVYDIKGNIIKKTDAGRMLYTHSTKPYAVTEFIPQNSAIPVREQLISYTSLMRPATIRENGYVAAFTYDAAGRRVKTYVTKNGKPCMTRYYIGECYERETLPGSLRERLYIGGDYYSAPVVAVKEGGSNWRLYSVIRDIQGSIMCITDETGKTLAEYSYDAWGRLRKPDNQKPFDADKQPILLLGRGYTGHEHLPWFGLINMNARLYDPILGRFLAPDPYIQMPDFSQNFNRYAYCLNNPLVYIDQDGESFLLIAILVGAAIGGYQGYKIGKAQGATGWKMAGYIFGGAAIGGLAGGVSAGMSAGLIGGFSAGLAPSIGALSGGAINGCGMALLGGESFKNVLINTGIGAATGWLGGISGNYAGKLGFMINNVRSPLLNGLIGGSIGGAAGGYVGGFTNGLIRTGQFSDAHDAGMNGLLSGMATGAITGSVAGLKYAHDNKINPWTGKENAAYRTTTQQASTSISNTNSVRTEPKNLAEQLTMQEAQSGQGRPIMEGKIKDPNWQGWQKMQHSHLDLNTNKNITIHYWHNPKTNVNTGFKFK